MGLETPRVDSPSCGVCLFRSLLFSNDFFNTFAWKSFYANASNKHTSNTKSCEVGSQNLKRSRLSWPRLRVGDKESQITAMMQLFVKPNWPCGKSNNIEASRLADFQQFWNCWTSNTFYQCNISLKLKNQVGQLESWFFKTLNLSFWWFFLIETNAALRGEQRHHPT